MLLNINFLQACHGDGLETITYEYKCRNLQEPYMIWAQDLATWPYGGGANIIQIAYTMLVWLANAS